MRLATWRRGWLRRKGRHQAFSGSGQTKSFGRYRASSSSPGIRRNQKSHKWLESSASNDSFRICVLGEGWISQLPPGRAYTNYVVRLDFWNMFVKGVSMPFQICMIYPCPYFDTREGEIIWSPQEPLDKLAGFLRWQKWIHGSKWYASWSKTVHQAWRSWNQQVGSRKNLSFSEDSPGWKCHREPVSCSTRLVWCRRLRRDPHKSLRGSNIIALLGIHKIYRALRESRWLGETNISTIFHHKVIADTKALLQRAVLLIPCENQTSRGWNECRSIVFPREWGLLGLPPDLIMIISCKSTIIHPVLQIFWSKLHSAP